MVGLTKLEAVKHLKKYRKHTAVDKDEIIARLVEMLVEEGIGDAIVGSFEIPEGPPAPVVKKPTKWISSHKTGELSPSITPAQINKALQGKIEPTSGDKSKYDWSFTVDGVECGIWDYRGSRWSTYGPASAFEKLGLISTPR